MNQLAIDFATLARSTDPSTSYDAAANTESFRAKHEGAIWGAIETAGDFGVTQFDIAGLTPVQANRRFKGMADRKLIKRKTICDQTVKRNGCCVWVKA